MRQAAWHRQSWQLEFQSLPDRHITTVKCTLGPLSFREQKGGASIALKAPKPGLDVLKGLSKSAEEQSLVEIFKHPDRDSCDADALVALKLLKHSSGRHLGEGFFVLYTHTCVLLLLQALP